MKKLLLALLVATSINASAAPFEASDRKAVESILNPWVNKSKNNPHESIAIMPPKFFDVMAKTAGMPKESLKQMMLDTIDSTFEIVEIQSYTFDLDNAEAAKSSSGRDYAFIPQVTKVKFKENGQESSIDGYMLAIEDGDTWYFMNWEPAYAPIIAEIYPVLKGLKAPQ